MKYGKTLFAFLAILVVAAAVAQSRLEFRAELSGPNRAKGKAVFKQKPGEAQLQVEGERLAANTEYFVTIGKNPSWTVTTDGFGDFRFNERYVGNNPPPVIGSGTPVWVTNTGGVVVMSGSFASR